VLVTSPACIGLPPPQVLLHQGSQGVQAGLEGAALRGGGVLHHETAAEDQQRHSSQHSIQVLNALLFLP
jgi:hypothetical protein